MSKQFTYEIDERILRIQLKSYEVPFSEEAWQNYQNFLSNHNIPDKHSATNKFQLPRLNRNQVIYGIIALLIVMGSFIVFKVINASSESDGPVNKVQTEAETVTKPEPIPEPQPVKEVEQIIPTVQEPTVAPVPEVTRPNKTINNVGLTETTKEIKKPVNGPPAEPKATVTAVPKATVAAVPKTITDTTNASESKSKRKKRASEINSALQFNVMPDLIKEERVPEERP
jgi:hypothetical protein